MRIQEMNITPIVIVDLPLLNAGGLHASYALRTIVEIVTDDRIETRSLSSIRITKLAA